MAAELSRNTDLRVQRKRGALGELRVAVDGDDVVDAGPLGYPTPRSVISRIERYLAGNAL